MQVGQVVGHATSTVKHPSLSGWKLLVVKLLAIDGKSDGEPVLAIDSLGAGLETTGCGYQRRFGGATDRRHAEHAATLDGHRTV